MFGFICPINLTSLSSQHLQWDFPAKNKYVGQCLINRPASQPVVHMSESLALFLSNHWTCYYCLLPKQWPNKLCTRQVYTHICTCSCTRQAHMMWNEDILYTAVYLLTSSQQSNNELKMKNILGTVHFH